MHIKKMTLMSTKKIAQNPTSGGNAAGASGRDAPNPAQKLVFIGETNEDWMIFYVLGDEILGVVLSKLECPTLEDFKRVLPSCEDAPIDPQYLTGLKIVSVQEVE